MLRCMGKNGSLRKISRRDEDPIVDQFLVASAKTTLLSNVFGMGWRLAITVLLPIFAGAWLDKRFGSTPSLTLAAFFLAIFAASLLIYRTYVEMTAEQKPKRTKKFNRSKDV